MLDAKTITIRTAAASTMSAIPKCVVGGKPNPRERWDHLPEDYSLYAQAMDTFMPHRPDAPFELLFDAGEKRYFSVQSWKRAYWWTWWVRPRQERLDFCRARYRGPGKERFETPYQIGSWPLEYQRRYSKRIGTINAKLPYLHPDL